MLAELLYFVSIALFGFVILGAVQLPNDMWLVAGIFPVFIAMILGYMMWVYAWSEFGLPVSIGSLANTNSACWLPRSMSRVQTSTASTRPSRV